MTLGELVTHLNLFFRRSDVAALLPEAIRIAHTQFQMDGDWRACEAHANLVFNSTDTDGVAVPEDYRNARQLIPLDDESVELYPLQQSTESESKKLRIERGQNTITGSGLSSTSLLHQRWWEEERRIKLLALPTAGEPLTCRLEYYKLLPFYADNNASDYFSIYYWPALAEYAKWHGSTSLWEDDRAMIFRDNALGYLAQAKQQDLKFKQGGAYRVHRPPLPGSGRR